MHLCLGRSCWILVRPKCLSGLRFKTKESTFEAVGGRGLQEDLVVPDDWARIAEARDRDFPDEVLLFVELGRQVLMVGDAGAARAAEALPGAGGHQARRDAERAGCEGEAGTQW